MKRIRLLSILLILCVANVCSQESENLILQFYGYNDNPYKVAFITNNLPADANQDDIQKLNDYYNLNEKEILAKYDQESYAYYLESLIKTRDKNRQNMAIGLNVVTGAVAEGVAAGKQRKAERDQQKAERDAQLQAEQQARVAQNKQKYADFQAMTSKSVHSSNYQTNTTSYNTPGNYNDLLTSDGAWNTQVQMWVQQYGVEKTREIVKQKRANNYQQSAQSSQSYTNNQSGNERIISAVTPNRQQIKIKVKNNTIEAYSNSLDQINRQNWILVIPNAYISKTGSGSLYDSGDFSKEFSRTANLNGTQIYFNM